MIEENKEEPKEVVHQEEPSNSEEQLTKEEINKQIAFHWKQIDSVEKWDDYIEHWKQYDHFRDLKQKLYK